MSDEMRNKLANALGTWQPAPNGAGADLCDYKLADMLIAVIDSRIAATRPDPRDEVAEQRRTRAKNAELRAEAAERALADVRAQRGNLGAVLAHAELSPDAEDIEPTIAEVRALLATLDAQPPRSLIADEEIERQEQPSDGRGEVLPEGWSRLPPHDSLSGCVECYEHVSGARAWLSASGWSYARATASGFADTREPPRSRAEAMARAYVPRAPDGKAEAGELLPGTVVRCDRYSDGVSEAPELEWGRVVGQARMRRGEVVVAAGGGKGREYSYPAHAVHPLPQDGLRTAARSARLMLAALLPDMDDEENAEVAECIAELDAALSGAVKS